MEKIRGKKLVYYIDNRSIKISFILYALISLVVGITISVTAIALVDNYRINLNYKYDIVNIGLHFILKNVRPYAAPCSEA